MSIDAYARKALAQEHVLRGRVIVEKQRQLVSRTKVLGNDCGQAERLLVQFEETLAIFERDLADLTQRESG
jgi:hypothetical protein